MQSKSTAITIGMKTDHEKGFTLIELMVTVSVLAIVLGVGVPGFQELIQNNRMAISVNDLVTDLNLTRSEAIKRGSSVTLCRRNAAGTACDTSANWLAGWIIFVDPDGDGMVDAGEQIIRVREAVKGLTSLNFSRTRVTFGAQGFSQGFNGTITFCDSRGAAKAKGRVLSNTGRLREASAGDALTCS